ncbi:MAG: hypothetical protein LCH69_06465 [Proteobacteria bacterium]|nr:hypothetical protein [Pseudomonadota bacterium]
MQTISTAALLLAVALGLASEAGAKERDCTARLNGIDLALRYDDKADIWSSFRERRLTRGPACPGKVVIAHMLPGLSDGERAMFCAVYDEDAKEYRTVAEGPRDGYGRCDQPSRACRMVNATKTEALEIGALGRDMALAGVKSARTSAGALVLSGQASALAGALAEAGGAAAAALSAPGVLAGAAASVVVVGGAVMVCG